MSDNKLVKPSTRKPPAAGMGRKHGSKNKATKQIKEMIEGALSAVGGQQYLEQQAKENPTAFMTLVGKILPKDVNVGGQPGNPLKAITEVVYTIIDANDPNQINP